MSSSKKPSQATDGNRNERNPNLVRGNAIPSPGPSTPPTNPTKTQSNPSSSSGTRPEPIPSPPPLNVREGNASGSGTGTRPDGGVEGPMGSDQVRGLVTQERLEGQGRSEQDGLESMRRSSRRRKDLFLPDAAQPEIIRANQKDMYYLAELRDQVDDAARGLMGTRWLHTWGKEVALASRLAYFSLTTLLGTQTLGEEYCDVMQYSSKTRNFPSIPRRAGVVIAHVLGPYLVAKAYTAARKRLEALKEHRQQQQQENTVVSLAVSMPAEKDPLDDLFTRPDAEGPVPGPSRLPTESSRTQQPRTTFRDRWVSLIAKISLPPFEVLVDENIRAVHLAVFYLWGRYYHLSKRVTGIRYVATQTRQPLSASPPSYEVLGVLLSIQLSVRFLQGLYARRREALEQKRASSSATSETEPADPSEKGKGTSTATAPPSKRQKATVDGIPIDKLFFDPDDPSSTASDAPPHAKRCTLCLEPRRDPASTECGHVFCWECIVGWGREKPECPLCRQNVNLSRLLPLYNF